MDRRDIKESSYLSHPAAAAVWMTLAFAAAYSGYMLLCGLLAMLALIGLLAYIWGKLCIGGLRAEIKSGLLRAEPGGTMDVAFSIKNEKLLPVIWLQLLLPYPKKGCAEPLGDFREVELPGEGAKDPPTKALERSFSWLLWHQTVEWTTVFEAKRRGVYAIDSVALRTGDGFGLSVRRIDIKQDTPAVFVVYPKQTEVDVSYFYRSMWSENAGARGYVEDVTVLRGTRDYQNTDALKRINWRLAARTDELYVNIYDMISPKSVHFLVDCASFCGYKEAFEETLSVIASAILRLDADRVGCGLSVTSDGDRPPVNVMAGGESAADDCLFAMAQADCSDPDGVFAEDELARRASRIGSVYYVCRSPDGRDCEAFFERTGLSGEILSYDEPSRPTGLKVRLLSDIRKG